MSTEQPERVPPSATVDRDSRPPVAALPWLRSRGATALLVDLAAVMVAVLTFVIVGTALTGDLHGFILSLDFPKIYLRDFERWYVPQGKAIFDSPHPTPKYLYSAFFAIVLSVFEDNTIAEARAQWMAFQAVLIVVFCVLINFAVFGQRRPRLALVTPFLVVASVPIWHNFLWGQVSLIMTVGALLVVFVQPDRPWTRVLAAGTGVVAAIKYYPAVMLAALVGSREWRSAVILVGAAVLAFVAVPVVGIGWDDFVTFTRATSDRVGGRDFSGTVNSLHVPHVLLRVLEVPKENWDGLLPSLRWIGRFIFAAHAGLAFIVCLRLTCGLRRRLTLGAALLLLPLPFVVATSWPHYFTFLPFAQALVLALLLDSDDDSIGPPTAVWLRLPLLGAAVLAVALGSLPWFGLMENWKEMSRYGFLTWSALLTLVIVDVLVVRGLVRRRQRSR
ncbi:MAG: glycosyltransferase family 87 protein [Enhygromyxa sp.]